jgi:hypothetical protein
MLTASISVRPLILRTAPQFQGQDSTTDAPVTEKYNKYLCGALKDKMSPLFVQ